MSTAHATDSHDTPQSEPDFGPPLRRLLDPYHRRLLAPAGCDDEADVRGVVEELAAALADVRRGLPRAVWTALCDGGFPRHPLHALLHEDPMTRAAWGDGADGRVEDFLADAPEAAARVRAAGPVGRAVHRALRRLPLAVALRNRRRRVAGFLDDAAESIRRPRALAISAGRLPGPRECEAAARGDLAELVAFDPSGPAAMPSDFADDFPKVPVRPEFGELADLSDADSPLRRRLGQFDVAVVPSLLDRLGPAAARRLVAGVFDVLRPGGAMLLANFAPDHADAAYMEAILGWRPVRRSLRDLERLTAGLPPVCDDCRRVSAGPYGAIGFLEVHKR